jgi:hypothetical protein
MHFILKITIVLCVTDIFRSSLFVVKTLISHYVKTILYLVFN